MPDINRQIKSATKWSTVTEIAAKLVAPVSTMVLARVLTPAAFGILVTATMVISFAEIFTDAGFQKYLIQHEFKSDADLNRSTNVAFWSNLSLSVILLGIIISFSSQIADIVGSKGNGFVISVSCLCIPLAAFSSIQMALFRRKFDFKTLFIVRMIGISIPIVITIPLALIFRSYWALIAGMLALNLSNAVILTIKSDWKPQLWYNGSVFKEMFSFTFWSMVEAITIWLTTYIDIFLVGKMLNEYYLGLYRTSMNTVGQFIGIVTAATTPVLFASLSRLQNSHMDFKKIFLNFQKLVGLIIIPMGVVMFIYRDLITEVLLGSQWKEAAYFIGLWALTSSITVVLAHYSSECYRAMGRPKLSVFVQISHILVIVPIVIWAIPHGFKFLCEARSLVRLELIVANMIFMAIFIKISPWVMLRNIFPSVLGGVTMLCVGSLLYSQQVGTEIIAIVISSMMYIGIVILFPTERHILFNLKRILRH